MKLAGTHAMPSGPEPEEWDDERIGRASITAVVDAADPGLARLLSNFTGAETWQQLKRRDASSRWGQKARALDVDAMLRRAGHVGMRFIMPGDADWPGCLDDLATATHDRLGGAPVGLWLRGPGSLADSTRRAVALVGSRTCSSYGERVSADLAAGLAAVRPHGWTVISGGAHGIDTAAHRGALAGGGTTVAVLACGLDVIYPAANAALFSTLVSRHLLVSEAPPGQRPFRKAFLARNRLIAALGSGTVIVEAASRSGAKNTASWATALGRQLMAVPGPISASTSETPHDLIRDGGATLVRGTDDILRALEPLGLMAEPPLLQPPLPIDTLRADLLTVREVLPTRGGFSVTEVAVRAGLPVSQCLGALGELDELGWAKPLGLSSWVATVPGQPSAR